MKKYLTHSIAVLSGILIGVCIAFPAVNKARRSNTARNEITVQCDTLSQWNALQLAIIKTESQFNELAVGNCGDLGLYQMTEIYVDDVNRILGEPVYAHTDAFIPEKAVEMFAIFQNYYNSKKDIIRAINLHNPNGDAIGYSVKVLKNMKEIERYEKIRATIIEKSVVE